MYTLEASIYFRATMYIYKNMYTYIYVYINICKYMRAMNVLPGARPPNAAVAMRFA